MQASKTPSIILPGAQATPDLNHLTAQQYTNWKFKSTGQRQKAIGHFYDKFETADGCHVPAGLFHDRHVIHVPGQAPPALAINRDESKFYGKFTTKDGYQVPAGLFHSPEVVSVPGQAIGISVHEVANPSPNSVPSPVKHFERKGCCHDRTPYHAATTPPPSTSAGKSVADSEDEKPSTPMKGPGSCAAASQRSLPSMDSPKGPYSPTLLARRGRMQSPIVNVASARGAIESVGRASVVGLPKGPSSPRQPVVVSRPSVTATPSLQSPRITISPFKQMLAQKK